MNRVLLVAVMVALFLVVTVNPTAAQLPEPSMEIDLSNTALVITDPQNDFLHPDGAAYCVVGQSVEATGTVANLEALLATAKETGMQVFISPHYY